jgi:polyhydroxybutyrate depolymerase
MRGAIAILAAMAGACGGGGGGDDDGDDGADDAPAADAAAPDAGQAARCEGREAQPVDAVWTLPFGGVDRAIRVHVPASYDPTIPTPVVLAFHGYTLDGAQMEMQARLSAKADAEGFVVAYPDGTGALRGWNAGDCCGSAAATGVDDVGFADALIDEMQARLCVDRDHIHATGFSNGGFLSHRLGCERADRIASIAPVSGVMGIDACAPVRPMPVFHVHGTADAIVPYGGGGLTGFRSVDATIADWAARNACATPPAVSFAMGDATCVAYPGCAQGGDVVLCTIEGGGHQWPGGNPFPGGGHTSTDLVATDAIWDFFAAHPRITLL